MERQRMGRRREMGGRDRRKEIKDGRRETGGAQYGKIRE